MALEKNDRRGWILGLGHGGMIGDGGGSSQAF